VFMPLHAEVPRGADETNGAESGDGNRGLALTAICLGFMMITLDATIVNVALPAIHQSVGGNLATLQWVVDAYTIVLAAFLLSAGWVADRLGARRIFYVGLTVFVIGSAACAAATNETVLVITRAVQGFGGAALLPASLAMIVHEFPRHEDRARALGLWGGLGGLGSAAGPVLGGLAVGLVSWRLIFVVNVPLGLLAFWLTRRAVSETPHHAGGSFDVPGQILGVATLGLLVGAFIEAGQEGWTATLTLALFASGLVLAAAFVTVEARRAQPMLPLAIFGRSSFRGGVSIGLLFNFCLYGSFFCLALYLEQTLGLGALAAGLYLLPMTVMIGLASLLSGRLIARYGTRLPLLLGAGGGLTGALLFTALGPGGPKVLFLVASFAFGWAALAMPAMTTLTVQSVPPRQSGLGSGVLNAARQTGGAFGVAVLGSLLGGSTHSATGAAVLRVPLSVTAVAFAAIGVLTLLSTRSDEAGQRAADSVRSREVRRPPNGARPRAAGSG
jgi:DHA2 family methylenomycin A resistance protein-like MFS transporter